MLSETSATSIDVQTWKPRWSRAPHTCPWAAPQAGPEARRGGPHSPKPSWPADLDLAVPHGMLARLEDFPEKTVANVSLLPAGYVSWEKSLPLSEPPCPEPMVLQALVLPRK